MWVQAMCSIARGVAGHFARGSSDGNWSSDETEESFQDTDKTSGLGHLWVERCDDQWRGRRQHCRTELSNVCSGRDGNLQPEEVYRSGDEIPTETRFRCRLDWTEAGQILLGSDKVRRCRRSWADRGRWQTRTANRQSTVPYVFPTPKNKLGQDQPRCPWAADDWGKTSPACQLQNVQKAVWRRPNIPTWSTVGRVKLERPWSTGNFGITRCLVRGPMCR